MSNQAHARILDIMADLIRRFSAPETASADHIRVEALEAGARALREGCVVCRTQEQGEASDE